MRANMRVISGGGWTSDGRWVVVAEWYGCDRIVYDPGTGDPWTDLQDCLAFVREQSS